MMSRLRKALILGGLTGLLGFALGLFLPLDLEESIGLDLLFNLRGARTPPPEVIIVSVDKTSAERLQMPTDPRKWSRSLHAHLTEILAAEGAAVIAFDIFFDEAKSSGEDGLFADAARRAGNVVLCESLEMDRISPQDREKASPGEMTIVKLIQPTPSLAQSAAALAPFPLPKVPVKVSRYWTFKTGAGDTPTLPVVAFQIFTLNVYEDFIALMEKVNPSAAGRLPRRREEILRSKTVERVVQEVREIFEEDLSLAQKMLDELARRPSFLRDSRKTRLLECLIKMYQGENSNYLNFYGPSGSLPTVPYHQVLKSNEDSLRNPKPVDFKGQAVFVGLSEGLRQAQNDGFYTTFSQANGLDISGVEIAATAFSNLLADQPVRPLGSSGHLVILFLGGVLIGVLSLLLPPVLAAGTTIALSLLYFLFARAQFNAGAIWYPIVLPLLIQFPLAFFGAVLWRYVDSNRERQNIRKAFGYYLPKEVVVQLSRDIAHIRTTGQLVYGICLSTDAEHYTSLSESLDPKDLGDFMNRYYETVFAPIKERAGVVSNVVGDSVLALWVTGHPETSLRREACLAALGIGKALRRFNQSSGPFQLPTRIGLHSGPILLGHIGAMDHYEYRPLGDIVNTTTRVEGLNKHLGTRILATEEVVHQLDRILTREIGTFLLVGKTKPLTIYGLMGLPEDSVKSEGRGRLIFAEALAAFRRRSWEEAIERFRESNDCFGEDGPSRFYIRLCGQYQKEPPAEDWNGVIRMDRK